MMHTTVDPPESSRHMDVIPANTVKWIIVESTLTIDYILHFTMARCIGRIAEWANFLTSSNCSHSKCVLSNAWCQAWNINSMNQTIGCYNPHRPTTHGLMLDKVVGDCSTSIQAMNLTPGDSYSGGVHWSDCHQSWSSCNITLHTCKEQFFTKQSN